MRNKLLIEFLTELAKAQLTEFKEFTIDLSDEQLAVVMGGIATLIAYANKVGDTTLVGKSVVVLTVDDVLTEYERNMKASET